MSRNICITAVDGNTGSAIVKYILENDSLKKKVGTVTGLALKPNAPHAKELAKLGAKIVQHKPGRIKEMVQLMQSTGADTVCLIPPASEQKMEITQELIEATKRAGIPNVCFISSAGCDLADPNKQPSLRQFIELEALVLSAKGDPETSTGHSPVVIRPGFYAENLLLYTPQMMQEKIIPLPIGGNHKFAPMAMVVSRKHRNSFRRYEAEDQTGSRTGCSYCLDGQGKARIQRQASRAVAGSHRYIPTISSAVKLTNVHRSVALRGRRARNSGIESSRPGT
jgi:hypothetical protein